MQSFTDLQAWQCGLDLLQEVRVLTKSFPPSESDIKDQLHRSTKSILLNTAEGFGRYGPADKANKYTIARGECTESEAGILISIRLNLVTEKEAARALHLARQTGKLLSGLIATFRDNPSPSPSPSPSPASSSKEARPV